MGDDEQDPAALDVFGFVRPWSLAYWRKGQMGRVIVVLMVLAPHIHVRC